MYDLRFRKVHRQITRLSPQIVTNVFVQIVILLYLIDNNENTSWMILFGSATGVLIEAWKVRFNSSLFFSTNFLT